MHHKIIVRFVVLIVLVFCQDNSAYAQFRVGIGDSLYIAPGEKILILEPLQVDSGAAIINASETGLDLRSTALLNGTIAYAASGDQQILPFPHHALRIDGGGNKWLQSNITVATNLQLGGNAKLITGNYLLTLPSSATIAGTAPIGSAASSWVVTGNGASGTGNTGLGGLKIDQIGPSGRNNAVLFPVGPTPVGYNPVTLMNTGVTDDFTVRVSDQVVPGVPALKSVNTTWNISEGTTGGSLVTLVTQWNQQDEAVSFIRAVSGIVHSNGTTVDQHAGMGMALGSNPFTRSGNGFRSFSPFGVTSDARVLPVSSVAIQAEAASDRILLHYQVTNQRQIAGYEIQRSDDGRRFETLGQQSVQNESAVSVTYLFTDAHPLAGSNFYRIKLIGMDGTLQYSAIAKANFNAGEADVTAYPNPVTQPDLYLNFKGVPKGLYSVSLLNASGSRIQLRPVQHPGMNTVYRIALPRYLAQGTYYAEIRSGSDQMFRVKLMVHYE